MGNPGGNPGVSKGRKYPNLVMEYDNEKGSEFRVQCEVVFAKKDPVATRVQNEVAKGTPEGLKRARKLVLDNVDPGASKTFRHIIEEAFDDNIGQLDMAGGRR